MRALNEDKSRVEPVVRRTTVPWSEDFNGPRSASVSAEGPLAMLPIAPHAEWWAARDPGVMHLRRTKSRWEIFTMRKLRMRFGAAVLIALLALSAIGGAAHAQHGGDDP